MRLYIAFTEKKAEHTCQIKAKQNKTKILRFTGNPKKAIATLGKKNSSYKLDLAVNNKSM